MARKTPIASAEEWFASYGPLYPCGHPRTKENSYLSYRENHWFRCKTCTKAKAEERRQRVKHTEQFKKWNAATVRRQNAQVRAEMIVAYGGRCQCCGETEARFLTLEHKNNDGAHERRSQQQSSIIRRLRREGWPKDAYTVLCANCNMARKWGQCPHETTFTSSLTHENRNHTSLPGTGKQLLSWMLATTPRQGWSDCASWRERANPTPTNVADLRVEDSSTVWSD